MPLSTKQMEYLALAWQCFETEPKIDYDKFKDVAGLASAASARELMRVTKKKLKEEYGALSSSTINSNSSPMKKSATPKSTGTPNGTKRGRGKKAAAEVQENGDDEEETVASPTKKAKKTNDVVKREAEEDSDQDGELV